MASRPLTIKPFYSLFSFRPSIILLLSLALLLSACQEHEVSPRKIVSEENQHVNKWILKNMTEWYLWNDQLPAEPDLNDEPSEFFSDLLISEDRFSWLQPNYKELLNSLKGINKEAGFEFVLYKENESSNSVVGQILYIKPSSPAELAGLKRGDLFTKINGQGITTANYKELIGKLKSNHSLTYKPILVGEAAFDDATTVDVSAVEYMENPNYLSKIIEQGEKKIGYFVYNFFARGVSQDDSSYDEEMDQIFAQFKSAGVTDLVLDLRFNSGGSEGSAKNLASLIGAGINSSNLFFSRVYNDDLMEEIESDPDLGDSYLKSFFLDKADNIGNQLGENQVVILTSSRTASASELIINSLKPYMQVFMIGDVTYGKNVGSISIYEENDPKNTWGLQPIIVKVSNSAGFSDYADGFIPDIENLDNGLNLYPLGDIRENLLSEAIAYITGVASPGRVSGSAIGREPIGHSLDEKPRGFNLFLENDLRKRNSGF